MQSPTPSKTVVISTSYWNNLSKIQDQNNAETESNQEQENSDSDKVSNPISQDSGVFPLVSKFSIQKQNPMNIHVFKLPKSLESVPDISSTKGFKHSIKHAKSSKAPLFKLCQQSILSSSKSSSARRKRPFFEFPTEYSPSPSILKSIHQPPPTESDFGEIPNQLYKIHQSLLSSANSSKSISQAEVMSPALPPNSSNNPQFHLFSNFSQKVFPNLTLSPSITALLQHKIFDKPITQESNHQKLTKLCSSIISSSQLAAIVADFHGFINQNLPGNAVGQNQSTLAVVAFDFESVIAWISTIQFLKTSFHPNPCTTCVYCNPSTNSSCSNSKPNPSLKLNNSKLTSKNDSVGKATPYEIFKCQGQHPLIKSDISSSDVNMENRDDEEEESLLWNIGMNSLRKTAQKYFRGHFDQSSCDNLGYLPPTIQPETLFGLNSYLLSTPFLGLSPKSSHWIFPTNQFLSQLWKLAQKIFSGPNNQMFPPQANKTSIQSYLQKWLLQTNDDHSVSETSFSDESFDSSTLAILSDKKYQALWAQIILVYLATREEEKSSLKQQSVRKKRKYTKKQKDLPPHIIIPLGYRCCWGTFFAMGHISSDELASQNVDTLFNYSIPPGYMDETCYFS